MSLIYIPKQEGFFMLRFFILMAWTKVLGLFFTKQKIFDLAIAREVIANQQAGEFIKNSIKGVKSKKLKRGFNLYMICADTYKSKKLDYFNMKDDGLHYGVGPYGYLFSLTEFEKYVSSKKLRLAIFMADYNFANYTFSVVCPKCIDNGYAQYQHNNNPSHSFLAVMLKDKRYIYHLAFYELKEKGYRPTFVEMLPCPEGEGFIEDPVTSLSEIKTCKGVVKGKFFGVTYCYKSFKEYLKGLGYVFNEDFSIRRI